MRLRIDCLIFLLLSRRAAGSVILLYEDRFGYGEVDDEKDDNEKDDDEQVDDKKDDEELCYQTPSRWKLPPRNQVLKAAKSIIAYTLNVLRMTKVQ